MRPRALPSLATLVVLAACGGEPRAASRAADASAAAPAGAPDLRMLAVLGDSAATIEGLAYHDGALYTAEWGTGAVYRIDLVKGITTVGRLPVKPNGWILGLATDATGNLYAAAPDEGVIWRIDAPRLGAADFDAAKDVRVFATGAQGANGLAVAPDGHVWISGGDQNAVYHVGPEGGRATVFASGYTVATTDTTMPVRAYVTNGLGIDSRGNIYTANTGTGEIMRLEVKPGYQAGAITPVVKDRRLLGADGIVAEGDTLYVTANFSNTIARIDPNGAVTILATDDNAETLRFPAEIKKVGNVIYVANLNFPVGRNTGQAIKGASIAALVLP
jgi:sugar lactone lactonase YvrE